MIFSRDLYHAMVETIQIAIREKRTVTIVEASAISVPYNALISLYSQYYLKSLRKESSTSKLKVIVERMLSSQRTKINTSLLQVLEESSLSSNTTSYYRLVKYYLEERIGPQLKISDFMADPSIIPEPTLREELLYLISHDLSDAPDISLIKENMGKEYEQLLINLLDSYHFLYETESEMRKKGKPKTPDIWFTIPMATILLPQYEVMPFHSRFFPSPSAASSSPFHHNDQFTDLDADFRDLNILPRYSNERLPSKEYDFPEFIDYSLEEEIKIEEDPPEETTEQQQPQQEEEEEEDHYAIINWIDSKAMFADLETFQEHYQQLQGYYLRYGRGMVIYWHGLSEEVYTSDLYDGNIIVRDSFPEKWIFPTGEMANQFQPPTFQLPSEYHQFSS